MGGITKFLLSCGLVVLWSCGLVSAATEDVYDSDGHKIPNVHPVGAGTTTSSSTIADGADVTQGAKADAAVTNPASTASEIALLKGQLTELVAVLAKLNSSVVVTGTFWQATQPVSGTVNIGNWPGTQAVSIAGTVPVSAASLPLPTGVAADATLTDGTAKAIARGGTKGSTTAADVTSSASGANHQPLDVIIYDASGSPITSFGSSTVSVSNFPATQPVSAASLPLPSGAATAAKQPALGTAGTPSADVITVQGATSMTALKVDNSAVNQPIAPSTGTFTNRSGTITAANTSQQVAASNSSRRYFLFQNVSDTDMWINFNSAATQGSGSIRVTPGSLPFTLESSAISTEAINVICAVSGKAFTAKEM